jgi:hypothetical protein
MQIETSQREVHLKRWRNFLQFYTFETKKGFEKKPSLHRHKLP